MTEHYVRHASLSASSQPPLTEYDLVTKLTSHFFHINSTRYASCQLKVIPGSTGILRENAVNGKFARGL